MSAVTHQFDDLNRIMEGIHALFKRWKATDTFCPPLDDQGLEHAKLAIHEWVANLVQHAEFEDRTPSVSLTLISEGQRLRCTIVDNSNGFDIDRYLNVDGEVLKTFPERGMGLFLLKACADELSYRRSEQGQQRIEFYIAAEHNTDG